MPITLFSIQHPSTFQPPSHDASPPGAPQRRKSISAQEPSPRQFEGQLLSRVSSNSGSRPPRSPSPGLSTSDDDSSMDDMPPGVESFQLTNYAHHQVLGVPEANLTARANQGDSEVDEVLAGQTRTLSIPPGKQKTVFTQGMNGCYAMALISAAADGKRNLTMTHHPEISFPVLSQEIHAESGLHTGHRGTAIIVAPGSSDADSHVEMLENLARTLGVANVLVERYDPGVNLAEVGSAFIVNLPGLDSEEPSFEAFSKKRAFSLHHNPRVCH